MDKARRVWVKPVEKEKELHMKCLHISDLHIGKSLLKTDLSEDIIHILGEITAIAARERVDAVLIAGDIYDSAAPSAEAVRIFDEFLTGLAELRLHVLIISGNHDSRERLQYASRLFSRLGIHINCTPEAAATPVTLTDEHGCVDFYLLPYLGFYELKRLVKADIKTYEEGLALILPKLDTNRRSVLMFHQYVGSGGSAPETDGSEAMNIGGLGMIDGALFDEFDYTALGHLHRAQAVGGGRVRYCGSPLKYSASEVRYKKTVTLVDLREKGGVDIRELPLTPLREVRTVCGHFEELIEGEVSEDYIYAELCDAAYVEGDVFRLRLVFPNLIAVNYTNIETTGSAAYDEDFGEMVKNADVRSIYTRYVKDVCGRELSPVQEEILDLMLEKLA